MKITIYTITDCQFSAQEKDYLKSRNLPFEEKNLETNRDFLTEMLAISNNFAGTPVTKIEKDDGQIIVLKGFTKEEFDAALGQPAIGTVNPQPTVSMQSQSAQPSMPPTPVQSPTAPPVVDQPQANSPSVPPPPSITDDTPVSPVTMQPPPQAPDVPAAPPVEMAADNLNIEDTLNKLNQATVNVDQAPLPNQSTIPADQPPQAVNPPTTGFVASAPPATGSGVSPMDTTDLDRIISSLEQKTAGLGNQGQSSSSSSPSTVSSSSPSVPNNSSSGN